MADITITTAQLARLAPALVGIDPLSPPPTAKGRYAIGKMASQAMPAFALYEKQNMDLVRRVATQDEDGKPLLKQVANQVIFNVREDAKEEWERDSAAILAEPVVLVGVRQITHAELGDCPITVQQERILIECGLLDDVEPA